MANRPAGALLDGCDLSQHIRDAQAMSQFVVPGGGKMVFAVRYTSPNTSGNPQKQLTRAEIPDLRAARMSLVLVHEEGASAALGTYADGAADAAQADAFIRSMGMPPDTPIHGAIDFDASGPDVEAYVRGFTERLGPGRRGFYGGRRPLRYLLDLGLLDYAWQTYAWSVVAGRVVWTAGITAAQWRNDQTVAGNNVDFDSAMVADYGQLGPDWTSTDRDVMTQMDLTPQAIAAVRDAILNAPIGSIPPAASDSAATLDEALRAVLYRTGWLANTQPGLLGTRFDSLDQATAATLAQSKANGSGISQILAAIANIGAGAGLSPAEMAAAFHAAGDALVPPATP